MSRRSYPPIREVEVAGERRWEAYCRTCGQPVTAKPQVVKAAVEEARRWHGFEADCTRDIR